MRIEMSLKDHSYDILLDHGAILQLSVEIQKWYKGKRIFVLTDKNVYGKHGGSLENVLSDFIVEFVVIEAGESSKSMSVYEYVLETLLDKQMKRGDLLITFGGGVVGDLGGFVAATLYRGVPYIQIPTTLLSQVDSSIGGKTAINSHKAKNMIGSFYQPKLVIIDPNYLKTLSDFEYKNGMAEVIKSACIGDTILFDKLLNGEIKTLEMIERTLLVKKKVVEMDEFDLKERMYLNFGHTFGHALEKQSDFEIAHGFAVAEGMLIALEIGEKIGITPKSIRKSLKLILDKYDLGLYNAKPIPLIEDVFYDKKNIQGELNMIFLKSIGNSVITPVTKEVLYECYNSQTLK
ncbi:3-dehydroquinate synthase [Acholeplasma vituli]|uniref:3-dehydroquinate synthase n=1 Tax=Paracholeplasma vituli TaxID=69473 RepID=A0ABT2PTT8_9MOLU|nr:3-dehydroquinate synthase [Paracholeplasma vituli]MCU0104366.1 3-dehydroquinate synthase [Paracholeplasma vituli]